VVVYGLDGNGALDKCQLTVDTDQLTRMLETVLPSRRPHFVDTGSSTGVEYRIRYRVIKAKKSDVDAVTSALADALSLVSMQPLGFVTHTIDISTVVHIFSRQAVQYADGVRDRLTVLVINPDKRSLIGLPTGPVNQPYNSMLKSCDAGFNYTYKAGNEVGLSCSWLGSGSYVVIDLSAGPCEYGPLHGKGAVSADTLPSLMRLLNKPHLKEMCKLDHSCLGKLQLQLIKPVVLGLLCSSITSAIEHVLIPDVAFEEPAFARRVLVSILMFREKQNSKYSSLDDFNINADVIKKEMKKMLLGGQELVMTSGIHNLHDHPLISVALRKALKEVTASNLCFQRNCSNVQRFLSSSDLLKQLQHTHDLLAEGLLTEHRDFLLPQYLEDITGGLGSLLHDSVPIDVRNKLEMRWRRLTLQGARIVPVYIFDMSVLGGDVLFDQESSVSWNSSAVLVLNSKDRMSSTNLPYFSTCGIVSDSNKATQHIVAGLAGALGSIVPPHIRFSHIHNKKEADYLWAVGFHPFSLFSGTHELSWHFSQVALRNSVLSQMQSVFAILNETDNEIQEFSSEHLHPVHDDEADHHLDTGAKVQTTVLELKTRLSELKLKVESFLNNVKLNRLSTALDDILPLVTESSHLQLQCHQELSEARTLLSCCHKMYYASRVSWKEVAGVPLALAGVILLMMWFVSACLN
jgi:hypothetical protein